MTLLALDRVAKRFPTGSRGASLGLRNVSLEVESGELVAVFGGRASGRTTLLRLAGGLERPDGGVVYFDGLDVADHRDSLLGRQIAFGQTSFHAKAGQPVLEHVALVAHLHGASKQVARERAFDVLKRVEALDCATLSPRQLDQAEMTRVLLARALVSKPRLILLDEPTKGVDLAERDGVLSLVRSIADGGTAVLMTVGETTEFAGATRALSLDNGELRGALAPSSADVVPLQRQREA